MSEIGTWNENSSHRQSISNFPLRHGLTAHAPQRGSLDVQEFRSEDLPPAERFDYWCELLSKTHAPMALSSDYAADFTARQRLIRLGGVSLWPTTFQPLVFDRTPKLIEESDPEAIHLSLLLKGAGGVIREREQASYRPYDFHSSFTSQPYTVWSGSEPVTMIGVEVPKTLLPLPRAERVVGRPPADYRSALPRITPSASASRR